MELSKETLQNTVGGASKLGIGLIIGGLVTIIVGIIDGYLRPLKCNNWLVLVMRNCYS